MKKEKSLLQQFVKADPKGNFLREVINNKEIKEGFKFATDLYSKGHTEGQKYLIGKIIDKIDEQIFPTVEVKRCFYAFRDSIKEDFKEIIKTA